MNSPRKPAGKARGIRQTMSELHIWTGLLAGWLLYAMFLTGTVSYFRDELSAWMRPERQALFAQMSALVPAGPPSGTRVPLAPVGDMFGQAETRWGKGQVGRVTVNNPGDAAARVVMVRGEDGRVSVSPRYLVFDGTNGRLLQEQDAVGPAAETRGVLYALHLGRFGDTVLRWLYFLVSLAGTAMVGTGLVLWTVKRRAKLPDPGRPYFGFRLVERLNIAAIAGLSVAMAAFLWGNRLLPRGVPARADWEIHLFFIAWALAAAYTAARPPKRAWVELLWLACALLALLPVLNALVTPRGPWRSLAQGDWVYAGMDLTLWALAMLHAALAWRTARHKPRGSPRGEPARARAAARDAGEPAA